MKEPFELATESLGELVNALDDVTASLENVLLHLGHRMTEADRRGRWAVVEHAQALLHKLTPESEATDDEEE